MRWYQDRYWRRAVLGPFVKWSLALIGSVGAWLVGWQLIVEAGPLSTTLYSNRSGRKLMGYIMLALTALVVWCAFMVVARTRDAYAKERRYRERQQSNLEAAARAYALPPPELPTQRGGRPFDY